jgi:hypothetical protein
VVVVDKGKKKWDNIYEDYREMEVRKNVGEVEGGRL